MTDISLPVTALYAGICALFLIVLAARVIRQRRAAGVALFDGGDADLGKRIRAHGNFAEYVPLTMLLLAVAELHGVPLWRLHLIGGLLLAGRVVHVWAIDTENVTRRVVGMSLTFAALISGAVQAFMQVFGV